MAELRETFGMKVDLLVSDLNEADTVYGTAIARAASLETQAANLRGAAPKRLDTAIQKATSSLLALADSETSTIGDRALLEGVLQINQHKPSRVIWSGPADITGTLSKFDALSDGTPALLPEVGRERIVAGVITDRPVSVTASIAQGMGGLPKADITFGFRRIIAVGEEAPNLSEEEDVITQSHNAFGRSAIGTVAIQDYIDSQRLHVDPYVCGHGERTNSAHLEILARTISQLISVTGADLDTTHIDTVVQEVARHRADRDTRRPIGPGLRGRQRANIV